MISYRTFMSLKMSATEFEREDDFLIEEGGAFCSADMDETTTIAHFIFTYAHAPEFATVLAASEDNQREFAREYRLSRRTVGNWITSVNTAPQYVIDLLAYAVLSDMCGVFNG